MLIMAGVCTGVFLFLTQFGIFQPVNAALAENVTKADIDQFITKRLDKENIPGLAVSVVKDGRIEYMEGFGVTNVREKIPVTPQTVFDMASCSKSFTSLSVMLLVNDGLIELDDPVNSYLTDLIFADEEEGALITVRQLLNHTSGLPSVFSEPMAFHMGDDAMDKLINSMGKVHLNRYPGTSFEYSNMNYSLLGALIERISGMRFEDFVQERVFSPLGMVHTTLYPEEAAQMDRASGHQLYFGRVVPRDIQIYRSASAAGWVMSCAEDMSNWLKVHLDNGRLNGKQVFPAEIIKETHTPSISFEQNGEEVRYGMGWLLARAEDGTLVIWHGGDTPNFVAEMILVPEYNAGIVMMVNGQTSPHIHSIAIDILNIALGYDLFLPDSPWWASWEAIDRIATGALGLSFIFFISLIFYIRLKLRRRKTYVEAGSEHTYRIWKIVLPSAPLAFISLAILAIFAIAEVFLGYNIFSVLNRFGEYAPPGVSISASILFIMICLWALVLTGVTVFRARWHFSQ